MSMTCGQRCSVAAMTPADVAHAALLEGGRPDLAEGITWHTDGVAGWLEFDDNLLSDHDWAAIDQAEMIACRFAGLDFDRGPDGILPTSSTTPTRSAAEGREPNNLTERDG